MVTRRTARSLSCVVIGVRFVLQARDTQSTGEGGKLSWDLTEPDTERLSIILHLKVVGKLVRLYVITSPLDSESAVTQYFTRLNRELS